MIEMKEENKKFLESKDEYKCIIHHIKENTLQQIKDELDDCQKEISTKDIQEIEKILLNLIIRGIVEQRLDKNIYYLSMETTCFHLFKILLIKNDFKIICLFYLKEKIFVFVINCGCYNLPYRQKVKEELTGYGYSNVIIMEDLPDDDKGICFKFEGILEKYTPHLIITFFHNEVKRDLYHSN